MIPENFSDIYHFLAEALSEPPDWLAWPGSGWPLALAFSEVSSASPAARERLEPAILSMEAVKAGSPAERRERYADLMTASASAGIWWNEAGATRGQMLGEVTWEVERWYRAAGLEIPGTELPDHASLELAFLAYLANTEQAEMRRAGQAFLRQHAGRWLPHLGRQLAMTGDPVYAPVGQALYSWLAWVMLDGKGADKPMRQPKSGWGAVWKFPIKRVDWITAGAQRGGCQSMVRDRTATPRRSSKPRLTISIAKDRQIPSIGPSCNLCMGCLAACPREAIRVQENADVTRLVLASEHCDGCVQCARRCERGALRMAPAGDPPPQGWHILFESPRDRCIQCGSPLVSQAEMQYVSEILGHPGWLALCQNCR